MRLEGFELAYDERFFLVTLSYEVASSREYKTIKLGAEDGKLLGARNAWVLDGWHNT